MWTDKTSNECTQFKANSPKFSISLMYSHAFINETLPLTLLHILNFASVGITF